MTTPKAEPAERAEASNKQESGQKVDWGLWYSILGGPLIWLSHLTLVYALSSLTCEWNWFPFTAFGLNGLQAAQTVATVVAVALTLVGALFGLVRLRRARAAFGDTEADLRREIFMPYMGLGLSVVSTVSIILSLVPVLTVPPCV